MIDERDIYDHFDDMRPFIRRGAWPALEQTFMARCAELAGPLQADRIAKLRFNVYERWLRLALRQAVARPAAAHARALYFEYNLDSDWAGHFFLCEQYNPESAHDDEWACEWLDECRGPYFEAASEIFLENNFNETARAKGSTLYLVARTVAAFGRCSDQVPIRPPAVCIGFHDQDDVFRVREAGH
jgi:hypothetical protein